MKVKCIRTKIGSPEIANLTIDKEYIVKNTFDNNGISATYELKDDEGRLRYYPSYLFKIVKEL